MGSEWRYIRPWTLKLKQLAFVDWSSQAMLLKSRVYSQTRMIQRVWRRRRGDTGIGLWPVWSEPVGVLLSELEDCWSVSILLLVSFFARVSKQIRKNPKNQLPKRTRDHARHRPLRRHRTRHRRTWHCSHLQLLVFIAACCRLHSSLAAAHSHCCYSSMFFSVFLCLVPCIIVTWSCLVL